MKPNSPVSTLPTLIVGQGIAGTLLAMRLWQNHQPFMICDRGAGNTSSAIASGLINPVVVKHFGLTWMATTLLPEADTFYSYLEKLTGARFYHTLPIFRIFHQPHQAELWNRRRVEENAESFMSKASADVPPHIHAPFGGGWIQKAARVDVESFIKATRNFFMNNNVLSPGQLDESQLQPVAGGWKYKEEVYARVVFCQGAQTPANPWTAKLPVNPLKGQLLSIATTAFSQQYALSRKVFVLPQGGDSFKVGATWEHTQQPGTTPEAKQQLLQHLKKLTHPNASASPIKITGHYYGFRPTVPDRRPLLGQYHHHPGLYIFNGLGSKGYMLAPWLSKHLYEHIFLQKKLIREVDVERYGGKK
ncbi:MAG: NAD(P)/FAD-dependent oxidoreductase [Bacteroidota bacterium]